ncbi:MAG TPA: serine hydrolase [Candidatus Egerieimonas faecigallinarum]|nr:serine hydrolase [Candidatus Egerieimonas faecigallinarum]
MNLFTRCTPEEAGIPSSSVLAMIKELQEHQVPMHSLLLARNGKLAFEGYYAPFGPGQLHRMFSISKSFTSLAIGLLERDGRISLDDPIINYFPEYVPEHPHPWLAGMTIRDMLRMQTCHSATTYKVNMKENWVESFFITPPSHPSGSFFLYDTSASHTLCALVEKLSGKPMLDYLKDTVLREIGFSEHSYFVKDPFGTSMGGSGMMAEPMDLVLVGMLLLNGGRTPDGRELLPEAYLRQACSLQSATAPGPSPEESCGYGYQFWRIGHNGFACYGMGGQYLICLPDQNLLCVTTADTQEFKGANQMIFNALYRHILPSLSSTPLPRDEESCRRLSEARERLSLPVLGGALISPAADKVQGVHYRMDQSPDVFGECYITFDSDHTGGELWYTLNGKWVSLSFGLGSLREGKFPGYDERCACCAAWLEPDLFYLHCQLIGECVGRVHFQIRFAENGIRVRLNKTEETYYNEYKGFLTGTAV